MIVRPPEYLEDVRERELEMQAAEARLHSLNYFLCPHCDTRGRARLPALPELHAQAQGPVRELRQAAGPVLAHLPVLRGRDPGRHARAAQPQAPPALEQRDEIELEPEATASFEAPPQ